MQAASRRCSRSVPKQNGTSARIALVMTFEKATKVRVGTLAQYQVHLDLHLVPALGKHRVDRLRVKHLEVFCRDRRTAGLAPQTVNKLLTTAAAVFAYAMRHQYIEFNPAEVVERERRVVALR